jgi:hypothetical protein
LKKLLAISSSCFDISVKSVKEFKNESAIKQFKLRIAEDTACVASKTSYIDEDGLDKNGIYYFGKKPKLPVNWKDYKKDDNKKYGLKEKLRISESLIPNVVYHGGPVFIKPEEFSTNLIPCFFSPYEEYSSDYAAKNKTSVVTAYRLDIRNPFYLGDKECLRVYKDEFIPWAIKKGYADDWMNQSKLMNPRLGDKISFVVADYLYPFLRGCRRKGIYDYDGMIVSEGNSLYDDSYVPFDNSQISLA